MKDKKNQTKDRTNQIRRILKFLLKKTLADKEKTERRLEELDAQNAQREFAEGNVEAPIIVESSFLKMLSIREERIREALEALKNGWVLGVCFNNCGRSTLPEDKIDIVLQSPDDRHILPNRLYCVECVKIKQPEIVNTFCSGPKRWSHPGSKKSKRSRS